MQLPDLEHDFHHSNITSAVIGPRREITLMMQVLFWDRKNSYYSPPFKLRFRDIINFDEAALFFERNYPLELASLQYSKYQESKPNNLFIDLQSERTDEKLTVNCKNVNVIDTRSV